MNHTGFALALIAGALLVACERQPAVTSTTVTVPVPVPVPVPGPPGAPGATGATGATGDTGPGTTVIVTPPAPAASS